MNELIVHPALEELLLPLEFYIFIGMSSLFTFSDLTERKNQ